MCTHPITITRKVPLVGTKTFTVPCGKCAECVNKKRSELAALSVHQAHVSGDVRFLTLTYRNETCPVAIYDPQIDSIIGFERGVERWIDNGKFFNSAHFDKKRKLYYTPSLCREDIKKWLKQFRSAWQRLHGEAPKFKYCIFGEYGDRQGRPHAHGLFYGLTPSQVEMLANIWNERFGFVATVPNVSKPLSTDDVAAISQYVSKYISKGVHQRFAALLPYVEKPRRQSSLDFGQFSDEELKQYASFTRAAISSVMMSPAHSLDGLVITNFLALSIDGKRSRLMALLTPSRNE